MKFRFNSKSNTTAAYCIIVFAVCLLMVAFVFKYNIFFYYFKKVIKVLAPIIWGLCIAYLLNPLVMFSEKWFNKIICRKKQHKNLVRALSISVALIIMLALIATLIGTIVPEILKSMKQFISGLPTYLNNLQDFIQTRISNILDKNPKVKEFVDNEFDNIQDFVIKTVSEYQPRIDSLLAKDGLIANITGSAWIIIIGLKNFFLGIIISIYLLFSKETFIAQTKKTVHALFSQKRCERILKIASKTNYTFIHFIAGKAVDSFIIGILTFIGLSLFNISSYSVLIGVIIGITNMIPFFGPIIGAIPCGVLILLTTPNKTIIFIIFIILLQQFDGNILGPKILGNSLGLSAFWIMFAIFVGGGLLGFAGMVAFVPLFAVGYNIIKEMINYKLKQKKLPVSTAYYRYDDNYDKSNTETDKKTSEKSEDIKSINK